MICEETPAITALKYITLSRRILTVMALAIYVITAKQRQIPDRKTPMVAPWEMPVSRHNAWLTVVENSVVAMVVEAHVEAVEAVFHALQILCVYQLRRYVTGWMTT